MVRKAFLDELTPEELMQRLMFALDGAGVGIWDWDLRDDRVQFDERWCEMLGLDHASTPMVLETWSSRVHPDDIAACYRDIAAHVEGRTPRYENVHRMRHADGRWIAILDRGRISGRDAAGRPIRFTGTHSDITETERAKDELLSNQRQLATLVDNLPTGVALFGADLALRVTNRTWLDNLGLPPELPVRGVAVTDLLPSAACVTQFMAAIQRAREHMGSADESRVIGRDGRERWLRWQIVAWEGPSTSNGGVLFCTEDVTAQVESRCAVERERSARIASLALFAGGVAHELNSPLQVLVSEAELMAETLASLGTNGISADGLAELARAVESIATTSKRASALARALRSIARDARRDPPKAVSVNDVLIDVTALCLARARSSGIEFTVDSVDVGLCIWGRQADLLHALLNLVHRGLAAQRKGSGWIRIEVAPREREVVFRVSDGGLSGGALETGDSPHAEGEGGALVSVLDVVTELARRNNGDLRRCEDQAHGVFELSLPSGRAAYGEV
jgi:PAS domain S-box-containing protein